MWRIIIIFDIGVIEIVYINQNQQNHNVYRELRRQDAEHATHPNAL